MTTKRDETINYPTVLSESWDKNIQVSLIRPDVVKKEELWTNKGIPEGAASWRLKREYSTLQYLSTQGLPVPTPLDITEGSGVRGAEAIAFTMRRVPGYSLDFPDSPDRIDHFEDFRANFECYLEDALESLDSIHKAGYALGDIKPGTFIINPKTKKVTLVDFEFAYSVKDLEQNMGYGANSLLNSLKVDPGIACLINNLTQPSPGISFEQAKMIEISSLVRYFCILASSDLDNPVELKSIEFSENELNQLMEAARYSSTLHYLDRAGIPINGVSSIDFRSFTEQIGDDYVHPAFMRYGYEAAFRKQAVTSLTTLGIELSESLRQFINKSLSLDLSRRPINYKLK